MRKFLLISFLFIGKHQRKREQQRGRRAAARKSHRASIKAFREEEPRLQGQRSKGTTDRQTEEGRAAITILPSIDQSKAVDAAAGGTNAFLLCLGVFPSPHSKGKVTGEAEKECEILWRTAHTFFRMGALSGYMFQILGISVKGVADG